MFVISLVALIPLILLLLYQMSFYRRNKFLSKIPSPKKTALLHNSWDLIGISLSQVFQQLESWHTQLGDVFHITLHPFDDATIFIADGKLAEALSSHQPDRTESLLYKALKRWIGSNGFFMASASQAKARMKPVLNVFQPKFVDTYVSVMNSQSVDIVSKIKSQAPTQLDFFSWARDTALDAVFEIVLDFDLNAKNGQNKEYVYAVKRFCEIAMTAIFDPISRFDMLHPFTSLYREEKKTLKILHDFTRKIVQDRRKELTDGTYKGGWLMLNHFLETPIDGRLLTDEEVREEMDSIIFGAHDTTKSTIAFFFYCLAKYPEIQQKVYEEAKMILKDDIERKIEYKDLMEMPYIEAVIKETLRLFPPVPYLGRKLASEITTGGYTFPKGSEIVISPYLMGRNPKYFEDPLTFNPDRFYGEDLPPLGYIPFSTGARKCPGGKLAFMSMKISIVKVILNFKVSLVEGHEEVTLTNEMILTPKEGIVLNVERRMVEKKVELASREENFKESSRVLLEYC